MVYDPQFTDEQAEFFFVLTGSRPPEASLATLLTFRDSLLQAKQSVEGNLTPQVADLTNGVLMGMDTAVSVPFAKSMESMTSAPPYYLPSVADQYQQLAHYTQTSADEFLQMKVNSIVVLASLIVALTIDLVIALFVPDIGLELMASEIAAVRFLLSSLIGRLLSHLVTASVMSVGIQEALDAVGQLWLDSELHQGWNWDETLEMLEVGLLGAGMGLVLAPVDHMLGDLLGDLIVSGTDKVVGTFSGDGLGDAGRNAAEGFGELTSMGLVGGVHNAGHESLFNAMQGNGWAWSWGTFSGGGAQGTAGRIGKGLGTAIKGSAITVPIPVEDVLTRGLGEINPAILNDIANAGQEHAVGRPEPVSADGQADEIEADEPPAVTLLRAVGVEPGQDTAYSIALRTGFVPTIGEPSEENGYWQPVVAHVPMTGYVVPREQAPEISTTASLPSETAAAVDTRAVTATPATESVPEHAVIDQSASEPVTAQPAQNAAQEPEQAVEGQPVPAQPVAEPVRLAAEHPVTPATAEQATQLTDQQQPVSAQPADEQPVTEQPATAQAIQDDQATPAQQLTQDQRQAEPAEQSPAQATEDGAPQPDTHSSPRPDEPEEPARVQAQDTGARPHEPAAEPSANPGADPGALGGAEDTEAGPLWTRNDEGWQVTEHGGSLDLGPDPVGRPLQVPVPAGSRAVLDGSGRLQHVVLPTGVSYERDLAGAWSAGRQRQGDVIVTKTSDPVTLTSGDGTAVVTLRPENEVVLDNHLPVAYRQVRGGDGARLSQPRVFLPDGLGGWTETKAPVDAATYEAWLASANQAHDAARTLHDIAARSGPDVTEPLRLTSLRTEALRDQLLSGSRDDATAAIYEWIRRTEGVALRWTQLSASHALADGKVVNMAAGEGKSWLFTVDAIGQAVRSDVGAVHLITTRGNLADREFERLQPLLAPLGIDVHRMNSDHAPPAPVDGRPTIYIGTSQDVGFTYLKTSLVPGQVGAIRIDAGVDEIDEAFVYSNSQYILSEGVQSAAAATIIAPVEKAAGIVNEGLDNGELTPADFGRAESQVGGPAALTEAAHAKVATMLGVPLVDGRLTEDQLRRVNMAATAHYEYVENVHYVLHDGKVYIIDQTTHEVMYNPETATESRWNGGLAQAMEAKHGLTIRDDPATSKSVTARQLYSQDVYGRVTGASGTALGKGERFAAQGLSAEIADIPRYYASRLDTKDDHVSPDLGVKLDAIAGDIRGMQTSKTNQPQLILAHRNDLVADLSAKLTDLGVEHTAVDAKWFLEQGTNREAAFKAVIEEAGKPGRVLVINMQGARGVDIPLSDDAKLLGGMHVRVTARSGLSRDIDIQAENRAARSGDPGSVSYYISPDDDAFVLSANPDVQTAIIRYTQAFSDHNDAVSSPSEEESAQTRQAQTRQALAEAEQRLRDLVRDVQAEAGLRMGLHTPAYLANGPPPGTAASPAGTSPPPLAQPPPQQARVQQPPDQSPAREPESAQTVTSHERPAQLAEVEAAIEQAVAEAARPPGWVPFGGAETRSGFYFGDSSSKSADVLANELAAAQSFPRLDGATALHVHFHDGVFAVGGRALTLSQFHDEVVSSLGLPEGQPLILVACQTAAAPQAPGTVGAALTLAELSGRPVIGATADAFTTATHQIVSAHASFDADGRPVFDGSPPGDWVIASPDGQLATGLGFDLLEALRNGSLAAHLPGVELADSEPPGPLVSPVRWTRGNGQIPALGVTEVPPEAAPAPERVRGYLDWPGSLASFRQRAQDNTLIGPGNTYLELWAVEPAAVPPSTYLIEFTIGGGAALRRPGGRGSRLWLPTDLLHEATVLDVYRRVGADRERDEAFGVQGRRISDLAEGRPVILGIPGEAEAVLRVLPVEPEIRTNLSQVGRATFARTMHGLAGARLGPGEPISWLAKEADGLALTNAEGRSYRRHIGLSFLSPEERELFPWGMVAFDNTYVLERQKVGGLSTWETRDLPFQFTERTFFVHAHANPYTMVGPAAEGPLTRALNPWPGYRAVTGAKLARAVLESDVYQQAVQTYGDDLEVVLFSCMAVPHAREFAAGLGRPAWTSNVRAMAGPTPLGHRIGLRVQEGDPEPGWYLATPSGAMLQVIPVPFGGKATRSGFYIPVSPSEASDVQADEIAAARFFPPVDGATVLHVHSAKGKFLAGDEKLTPEQFKEQVLDNLDLVADQPLILVACQAAALPETVGPGRPASALASLTNRPVIAATGDAFTTPQGRVITAVSGIDANGYPVADSGRPADWVIARPDGIVSHGLGRDLLAILDGTTLAADLPGVAIRQAGQAIPPPVQGIKWGKDDGGPDGEARSRADLAKLLSLRQELWRLRSVMAESVPASESSAQAQQRAARIADAQALLPVLRQEIAELTGRGTSQQPAGTSAGAAAATRDTAARQEQQWRDAVAAARARFPSGHPATRPDLSFAEANAEVERNAAAAKLEARRAYWDPFDPTGAAAYAAYHGELARIHAWNMILDDLGIGRAEPDASEATDAPERSELLSRLRESENLLAGMLAEMRSGSAWGPPARWESISLIEARLRRVQADIDVFEHPLPDELSVLEQERERLESIPRWLELPFAVPAPDGAWDDRIRLAKSKLAEVRAKIATLRSQFEREDSPPPDAGAIDPPQRSDLTRGESEAWVQEQEAAAAVNALMSYPGQTGSPAHLGYVNLHVDQARDEAWAALLSASGSVTKARTPSTASELAAQMNYLALAAAASGLLAEAPATDVADVRKDIQRLLSRPGTSSAPTPEERQNIETRLDRLERIAAVVGSEIAVSRTRQLAEEFAAAQEASPKGEAAGAPSVDPALIAAFVTMLAELEPEIRAARDIAAPARPAPLSAGSILAELDALRRQAGEAAAVAGEDQDAAFSASVEASLKAMQTRILKLAGAEAVPGRALSAAKLLANARVRAATQAAADSGEHPDELTLPPAVTWLRAPADTTLHAQAAAAAPRAAGWATLVAHTDCGAVVDGDARLDDEAVASRLGFAVAGDDADGTRPPGGPAGAIFMVCDWNASAFHRLTRKPVLAPTGKATIMLRTGEVIAGSWGLGADGELVPVDDGQWLAWENGKSRSLGTAYLSEAARQLGIQLLSGDDPPDRAVGFYYTLTDWQAAALSGLGYTEAGAVGSFYESLITVAGSRLRTVLGQDPEPELVRQRIVDEFERDLGGDHPRYADLIAGSTTPDQVRADLRDPSRWDRQAADLVPHVAADVYGLDLRVLGTLGQAPPVGAVSGPRTAYADGHPYLLVRLADDQFIPVRRVEGADPTAWPLPATGDSELTAWGRELSLDQRRLLGQDAISAPLPAGAGEPADIGLVVEMGYLVDARVQALDAVQRAIRQVLVSYLRRVERRFTALADLHLAVRQVQVSYLRPGLPTGQEVDGALTEIAEADRFQQRLQQIIDPDRFASRSADLTDEYIQAATRAGWRRENLGDLAGDAAGVKALAEQAGSGILAAPPPPAQPGGVSEELDGYSDRVADAVFAAALRYTPEGGEDGGGGRLTRALNNAAEQVIGDILRELGDRIDALADGLIARLAAEPRGLLEAAQLRAAAAAAAAPAARLREHRDAVQNTAGWQARRRAALEEFERSTPSRELPPGFGVLVNHARRFPLGHQGRLLWMDGVPLSDGGRVAELVARALPPQEAHLADALRDEIEKFIRTQGRHAFAQRLLEGGLEVEVVLDEDGPDEQRFAVVVNLDLDMNQVHHVRAIDTEGTPVGQKRHHAVEADHEMIAGSRRNVEAERNLTGTADIMQAFGAGGIASLGLSLTGTSSLAYTGGYDIVSATKRAPRYEHDSAYFDFRGASLRTTVRLSTVVAPSRTRSLPLTAARIAFPLEVAPPKEPGDPPGAFRETPRVLPGSKRFGYTAAELKADADGSRQSAVKRIEKVLYHVLSEPEWVGAGLRELRERVFRILRRRGPVDKEMTEAVEFFLSEPSVLRNYADMFGPGAISPMIRDSAGNDIGQLVVTARLRTIQPSWIGDLGIKEEAQRFTNVWDNKEQSGAAVLTVGPAAGLGESKTGAHAMLGGGDTYKGGVQLGLGVSSARTISANTGSGDIRGMVIWGHSVLYLADVSFTVEVVRPNDTFATVRRAGSTVQMGVRVPGIQRARFEALLERAESGTGTEAPLPVDDEPDAAGSTRYPPESMVAGVGIGFSMIVALQGAEAVLPQALAMIRQADGGLPWVRGWTPAEMVYVQSQLSPRFTREGLTSHASVVFQPSGVRAEIFRPARSGWEIISVKVSATHGAEPSALGRVNSATLEVMPSGFAGQGGDDTAGSSANLNISFESTHGLGVSHEPRGLGFLAQGTAARSVTATTSAGATGFSLQAMLYVGPARLFTYDDVTYRVDVRVRHQANISIPGLADWLGHALVARALTGGRASAGDQARAGTPAGTALTSKLPGLVQFISHEDLAREAPVDPAAVKGEVGKTEVRQRFGRQRDWLAARAGRTAALDGRTATEVKLPSIEKYLAGDGHVVIDADAQVMEVLTSHDFGKEIHDLLTEVGLHDDTVRDLPWVLTEPAHLAAAVGGVRPGAVRHTFVMPGNPAKGEFQDRHAVLTIEGFPTNAREASPYPVKLFQMHVAEGGPIIGSARSKTTLRGVNVGIPGLSELFGQEFL